MAAFSIYNASTQAALYESVANASTLFSTYQRALISVSGVITQRIEGGSKMYKKSASAKVPFKAVDSGGNGVTGLTITAKTAKDGANPATTTNAVVESGQGWYYITLTATEMGGDIVVLDVSASGVTIAPITISTESDYTAARAALLDNADVATSSRASPTNITAGTITTVTNLTNAPTNGDLTATMKTSVTTAATAATPTVTTGDSSGTTTLLGRLTSTRAGLLDNLDAAVSSRSTFAGGAVASVTAPVTVGTNNDKTGYALSSAGVQAVWDALTSALTTAGSIGKRIADFLTGDAFARLGAPAGASIAADIATRSTYAGADTAGTTTLLSRITGALPLASDWTPTRAGKLDHLDADVSSRLAATAYTTPDNTSIAAIKAKTDNLTSTPADETLIIAATDAIMSRIGAAGANLTALGDARLAHLDANVSSVGGGSAPTAAQIADEVQTRTLSANIKQVNSISITGTGTADTPWGP